MLEAAGKQWLSFNAREDHLSGLTTGGTVSVMRNGADDAFKAVITKLRPLGTFATWQGIMTATPFSCASTRRESRQALSPA
jgi:HlyD family secretion protein